MSKEKVSNENINKVSNENRNKVSKPILRFTYPKTEVTLDPYPREFFNTLLNTPFQKDENREKYERLVSGIFHYGGQIPMSSLLSYNGENVTNALRTFKSILQSWEPKHEDKTRVCALILEDLNENRIS